MDKPVKEIQLTDEQSELLNGLLDKLTKLSQKPTKKDPVDDELLLIWQEYLLDLMIEATDFRRGRPKSTADKRYAGMRKVERLSGQYPTDVQVRDIFGKKLKAPRELVALLQDDVRQLASLADNASGFQLRIAKLKSKIDKKTKSGTRKPE